MSLPPDPGRPTVRPCAPPRDEPAVKFSGQSEQVCSAKSTSKGPDFAQIPADGIAPSSVKRLTAIFTPPESSLQGVPSVQKSAQSELICPLKSAGKVTAALFTESLCTISSIPATSDGVSPIKDQIWNAHEKAIPLIHSPLTDVSSSGREIGSTFTAQETLGAHHSIGDYSRTAASFSNSLHPQTLQEVGNMSMQSISAMDPSIKNAQSRLIQASSSVSPLKLDHFPAESTAFGTGFVFTSPLPVVGHAPAGNSRVDSAESLGRVDSAVPLTRSTVPAVSVVLGSSIPPTVSFRDILRRSSPPSQAQCFADIAGSMDEVPVPTDRDGIPGILFPDQVISSLSAPFKFSLVGRITGNRGLTPNSDILSALSCIGLLGSHTVRFLPRGYMVLTLSCEEDYLRFWTQPLVSIRSVVIRFSKWTPEFKFEVDSPIAPVWVRFIDLPLHLYAKQSLFPIAKILGNPVKIDEITADGTRGSFARVCVEIDVLQARPERIWVGWGDHSQVVDVLYEQVPHYCSHCQLLGHSLEFCSRNGKSSRPRRTRPHGKGVASDSPLQAHSEPSQGVSFDPPQSSGPEFFGHVSKRPRRRPVVRKDPARPISTKNYYEILQDVSTESGPGESSGVVKPRTQRFKTLLGKLAAEQNAAVDRGESVDLDLIVSSQTTDMVDVVSTSVAFVTPSVVLPVPVVELAPAGQDSVLGTPVSTSLPSLVFDLGSVGAVSGMVDSTTTECVSLPLPGRTRSQQRRYYRQKAAQVSLPYGRPPDPG